MKGQPHAPPASGRPRRRAAVPRDPQVSWTWPWAHFTDRVTNTPGLATPPGRPALPTNPRQSRGPRFRDGCPHVGLEAEGADRALHHRLGQRPLRGQIGADRVGGHGWWTSPGGPAPTPRGPAPHVGSPHHPLARRQPLQFVPCHVLLRSALGGRGHSSLDTWGRAVTETRASGVVRPTIGPGPRAALAVPARPRHRAVERRDHGPAAGGLRPHCPRTAAMFTRGAGPRRGGAAISPGYS